MPEQSVLTLAAFEELIRRKGSIPNHAIVDVEVAGLMVKAIAIVDSGVPLNANLNRIIASEGRANATISLQSFPRRWKLFGYLMSRKVREDIYEPLINDLQLDYLELRRKKHSRAALRWLVMCFVLRTLWAAIKCGQYALRDATWTWLLKFVPPGVRDAFRAWWISIGR